jgi:hypothetical protein
MPVTEAAAAQDRRLQPRGPGMPSPVQWSRASARPLDPRIPTPLTASFSAAISFSSSLSGGLPLEVLERVLRRRLPLGIFPVVTPDGLHAANRGIGFDKSLITLALAKAEARRCHDRM